MRNRRGQIKEANVSIPIEKHITIPNMKVGQSGKITEIKGGKEMLNRLNSLGIRPDKRITKIGSMIMQGPITIGIDTAQVAIGFNMAARIMVEPEQKTK